MGEERGRGRCGHGQTQLQTCLGTGGWPHCVTGHVAAPGKHQRCCYNKTYKQREGWGRLHYCGISTEMSKVGLQLQPAPPAGRPRVAEKGGEITARPGTAADSTNGLQ